MALVKQYYITVLGESVANQIPELMVFSNASCFVVFDALQLAVGVYGTVVFCMLHMYCG